MSLYKLLRDRASINILKILYDNEMEGGKYSMVYSDLKMRLVVSENFDTFDNLEDAELISTDRNGSGELNLSITQKGKDFVDQFDKLIEVMAGIRKEEKAYHVEYDLDDMERNLLLSCAKLKEQTGFAVDVDEIARDIVLLTGRDVEEKEILKSAKKLEELNLLIKISGIESISFSPTEVGERVAREQKV